MLVRATARLKYVSIPPKKMRLVANAVKGLPVEKALNILNFTPRVAAHHIAKTLKSAAANALSLEGTDHLKPESLLIRKIAVDAAPTMKRVRFQSMGRAFRIRKRYCHLTVELEGETDVEQTEKVKGRKSKKKEVEASAEDDQKKTPRKKKAVRKATGKAKSAKKEEK
jgi:large subunit ribosomal protein L22